MLNLELAGPEIEMEDGDAGQRIVLDLSSSSHQRIVIGKRQVKAAARGYHLTINAAFERVWEGIVSKHGIDWCGFTAVRRVFLSLHRAQRSLPPPISATPATASAVPSPQVISIELWHGESLVSGEVGVLLGRCYSCVSLFSLSTTEYSRCDKVRTTAAILWLRRGKKEDFYPRALLRLARSLMKAAAC